MISQVENQEYSLDFWKRSINPLTWIEILRQVLIAAGFGSKQGTSRRVALNKVSQLTKFFINNYRRAFDCQCKIFCLMACPNDLNHFACLPDKSVSHIMMQVYLNWDRSYMLDIEKSRFCLAYFKSL